MPLTIELPDGLAERLAGEAARRGLSLPDYAARLLEAAPSRAALSGAEVVEFWRAEGLIGTRPDIADSQAEARRLREQAQRRMPAE